MKFRNIDLSEDEVLEILEHLFSLDEDLDIVHDKSYADHVYIHRSDGEPVFSVRIL